MEISVAGEPLIAFLLASVRIVAWLAVVPPFSTKAIPVTHFRPSEGDYTQVSALVQQATADVISGKSPADAAATYATALEKAVGKANVVNN